MRWKSNKTKPVKNGLMDQIVYINKKGYVFYNVPLTGWGRDAKIGGKSWSEVKDDFMAWEYMDLFEQHFMKKTIDRLVKLLGDK